MLIWWKKHVRTLAMVAAFVAFLSACIFGLTFSSSYQSCVANKHPNQANQAQQNPDSSFLILVRCEAVPLNNNSGAITALGTLAIAFFTLTLWVVTTNALRLGRNEFLATHRPKLRVRYVNAPTPSYNWKPTAKIFVSNVGPSAAVLVRTGVDIFLREKGNAGKTTFDATPKDIIPLITLPAGKDAGMDAVGHTGALTSKNVADIINGVFELCLLGIVSYTDGNGIERSTSYFRVWDIKRKRFVRAPPDDEYAEWEFED